MNLAAIPTLDKYVTTSLAGTGSSAEERAVLENLRWEERLGDERLVRYAHGFAGVDVSGVDKVKTAHARYAETYLEIDAGDPDIPDTFGSANSSNFWPHIEENLLLLRIEDANFALRDSGVDVEEFKRVVDNRDNAVLARVCDVWNERRDRRPAFATTEIAVEDTLEAAGADWPHALRDNLGLGHLNPVAGMPPIPVLLLRYAVGEVMRDKQAGVSGFAIPTVIDGRLNPFFFPTPKPEPGSEAAQYEVGRAVNLACAAIQSEYRMGLELVHSFLAYRPEHIWRIGYISRPLTGDLSALRAFHLEWLRLDTDRDDFAAAHFL
ncbi:MAG: hypothetical protein HY777_05750 [Betaproteobacteria bacterium]|nr:hypothetical protein [Betaproteobacteria bacterium]